MGKMGRPKVDNPKIHRVSVRLTKDEYEKLKKYVLKHNTTVSKILKLSINNICKK